MKNFGIEKPCTENWNEMSPTEKGAFCQKCAKQVYDFTTKSKDEIKSTLKSLIGQEVCGRITVTQEQTLNAEFEQWNISSKRNVQSAFIFSMIVVFGLTLFSCEDDKEKETVREIQSIALNVMSNSVPEFTTQSTVEMVGFIGPEVVEINQEIEIMGAMTYDEPEIVIHQIQDTRIPRERNTCVEITDIGMVGGIGMSVSYIDYLEGIEVNPAIDLDENGLPIPTEFDSKVYPNPATTNTSLEIAVAQKDHFEISLYDMSGKFIQTIFSGEMDRGTFTHRFDLTDQMPGTYFVIVNAESYQKSIKFIKL